MDEIVERAMARWPNVPAICGWLRLDRRGRWMLVDRGAPDFDEARDFAGSPITNAQIVEFIERNYQCDSQSRWYWQNGPQRVFVDLEVAPLILRVIDSGANARLLAHTGARIERVDAAWHSPDGELILVTELGPGAIHDLDLAALDLESIAARETRASCASSAAESASTAAGEPAGETLVLRVLGKTIVVAAPDSRPCAARFVARPRDPD